VLMALTPLKALRPVNARFEGDYGGRVMREGCKSSGASEARGSGAGERRCGEILTGVGRHGGDDEADRWGPCGGDRGRRRRCRAAQTRRRDGFWQIRQSHAGRDGPSAHARPAGEGGGAVGLAGLRGRMGRWADWAESEGKILF
jgi:hypothetical protein